MLDIDLSSPQGRTLLAATAEQQFGAPLAVAAHRLTRLLLLRSPWAPGLRFVGGQAIHEGGPDALCDRRVFSQSGPAETLEAAFASCVGEAVEHLSQIERSSDIARTAPFDDISPSLMTAFLTPIREQLAAVGLATTNPIDWMNARALATGQDVLVPADWCVRRASHRMGLQPPWILGSGVAAGPDWDWAASRALLELIERDAAALWWVGGRRGRPIALHEPAMTEAARLTAVLRQDQTERLSWLLDITTDLGIPCVVALSCDRHGRGLACGFGARLTLDAAVRGALLENAQMELALILAIAKQTARDGGGAAGGEREDKALQLATRIDAAACDLLHPLGAPLFHAVRASGEAVPQLANLLAAAGIEAALVDHSRPEFGLPVVRAIAPDLQPMPSAIVTRRLQNAITETGGGERFTHGVPLF
jgi:ribosomal protein S12 methylthiotransferase accessory factor